MTTKFDVGEAIAVRGIITGIVVPSSGAVLYEVNMRSASGFAVTQVIEERYIIKEEDENGSKTRCNYQRGEQESERRNHNKRP